VGLISFRVRFIGSRVSLDGSWMSLLGTRVGHHVSNLRPHGDKVGEKKFNVNLHGSTLSLSVSRVSHKPSRISHQSFMMSLPAPRLSFHISKVTSLSCGMDIKDMSTKLCRLTLALWGLTLQFY
jgi:hypothetical protein